MPDLGLASFYTVSVKFPCPDMIDHFTYMTETERSVDSVYLYNKNIGHELDLILKSSKILT